MPGTVHVSYLGKSSQQPCEVGIIIIPIFQIRKERHREASYSRLAGYCYSMFEWGKPKHRDVKSLTQDHTRRQCQR